MADFIALRGNTYPVREQLKKLGCWFNGAEKAWMCPPSKVAIARGIINGAGPARSAERVERKPADLSSFRPTPEQAGLLSFLQASTRNLFVEAGAGCGKTTTALWLMSYLQGRKCMVAFNRDIKKDIEEKAPADVDVLTMNALGFRALKEAYGLRDLEVDGDYTFTYLMEKLGERRVRDDYTFFTRVVKLYDLARGGLADGREDVLVLASDFEIELEFDDGEGGVIDRSIEAADLVIAIMNERASSRQAPSGIDYVDQMWLPVARNLPMPSYDVLFIDEAQDTNALQIEMLARCPRDKGRVVAVGDRRQAIYQFRGADHRAVDAIVERFDMAVMPLMTTFRCAKKIVAEAQRIVPHFQAGANNPDGIVRTIDVENLMSEVRPGDFVISRTNAPLVSGCVAALARGMRATVVGRDVGKELLRVAQGLKAKSMDDFFSRLDSWRDKQIAKLECRIPVRESAIEAVRDKYACLDAIASAVDSVDALYKRCETLFTDDKDGGARIEFTSTHKAKGRERDRVFLLRDTFCKQRYNRETGEYTPVSEEEFNLLYVAITRAKSELVYVTGEPADRKGR